jgi:creatinine amidohydrolase
VVPHGVSRLPSAASKQVSDREKRLSMHAGHSETALMLALAPETVHMEHAVANFPPEFPIKLLSADGRPACAWTARDFGPSGVIGDPTSATRAQGEEILDTLASSWVQALTELYALRWVVRDEPTWGRGHETGHIQQTLA